MTSTYWVASVEAVLVATVLCSTSVGVSLSTSASIPGLCLDPDIPPLGSAADGPTVHYKTLNMAKKVKAFTTCLH